MNSQTTELNEEEVTTPTTTTLSSPPQFLENGDALFEMKIDGSSYQILLSQSNVLDEDPLSDGALVPVCRFKARSECQLTKKKSPEAPSSEPLLRCSEEECEKHAHFSCYQKMLMKSPISSEIPSFQGPLPFTCSWRCFKKSVKGKTSDAKQRKTEATDMKFWDNDGDPSSMDVLLEWITDQQNAEKYFGAKDTSESVGFKADDGITKQRLCSDIAQILKERTGIARSADSVRKKIDSLISSYRRTSDWIANTGEGIKESHSEESWNELIRKRFKYFFVLEPVMCDRPTSRPAYTSDDWIIQVDDNSVSEKNDDDDDDDDDNVCGSTGSVSHQNPIARSLNSSFDSAQSIASSKNDKAKSSKRPASSVKDSLKNKKQSGSTSKNQGFPLGGNEPMVEYYKVRAGIKEKEHDIIAAKLRAETKMTVAKMNLEMMKLRREARELNPNISDKELDEMFPFGSHSA